MAGVGLCLHLMRRQETGERMVTMSERVSLRRPKIKIKEMLGGRLVRLRVYWRFDPVMVPAKVDSD